MKSNIKYINVDDRKIKIIVLDSRKSNKKVPGIM